MKNIIQVWKKIRYKKTIVLFLFLLFVYFYDFTKDSHGFSVKNNTDYNITILKITNDDREIVILQKRKTPIGPKIEREIGCCCVLQVNAYNGSTLKITFKNANNFIQTASCKLERPNSFFQRFFGDRYYSIEYNGSDRLICNSIYVDSPGCKENGLYDGYEFKNIK